MQMASKSKQISAANLMLIMLAGVAVILMIVMFLMNRTKLNYGSGLSMDPKVQELQTLGVSDKVSDIEDDLNKTNLDDIDSDSSGGY